MQPNLPDRLPNIAIDAREIRASLLMVLLFAYAFNSGPVRAENLAAQADQQAVEKSPALPSTDGVASPSDRALVPAQSSFTSALPDRPMAVTGEPAMLPQSAFANADSAQDPAIRPDTGAKSSTKNGTAKRAR